MIKNISALTVLAIGLVTVPCSAWAEGWVLWKESLPKERPWVILDAYPLYEQCNEMRAKLWQGSMAAAEKEKIDDEGSLFGVAKIETFPYAVIKINTEKSSIHSSSVEFYCLPGSLDPRERK